MTPDGEVSSRTNAMGSGDVKYSHVLPEHLQAEASLTSQTCEIDVNSGDSAMYYCTYVSVEVCYGGHAQI